MEERKKEFLEGPFGERYGYAKAGIASIDDFVDAEFSRLKEGGTTYLDYAGAGLYSKTQIEKCMARLLDKHCFANPHSLGGAGDGLDRSLAVSTSNEIRSARIQVAEFFNTTLATHSVVFTSGCTASLKLVGECFNWVVSPATYPSEKSTLALLHPEHNSATGVREYALAAGAEYMSLHDDAAFLGAAERVLRGSPHVPHLLVLPAQCNFSGVRYDLSVIARLKEMQERVLGEVLGSPEAAGEAQRAATAGWRVLLDASAYVPYAPLDLSAVAADYVALSFYKMFGYPTGLGALIMRNDAAAALSRKLYFGGGTLSAAIQDTPYHVLRDTISERFEDGTVSFAEIPLLKYGFEALQRVGGVSAIDKHTHSLARYLATRLLALRHASGAPLCVLAGNHPTDASSATDYSGVQGPIVTFGMKRADGTWVAPSTVATLAALCGIQIRTGCACNPCACQQFLGISDEEALANANLGKVCWAGDMDIVNGKATGAIRTSLGYSSRFEDVDTFVSFIEEHFVDNRTAGQLWPTAPVSISQPLQPLSLSRIFIYPVKGCNGFEVDSWEVTSKGSLLYDREWAVVGPDGVSLVQKAVPTLCFVNPSIDLNRKLLRLEAKGMEPLELPIADDEESCDNSIILCGAKRRIAKESEENVAAASAWFTKLLGFKCSWARSE